ncbi:MAG: Crp/Fnr family transcriptional regulator [Cytophagales bacterium]|nr:MAG: Crp/Fnr family transcriptional regulator [Cytophagales bacterium]
MASLIKDTHWLLFKNYVQQVYPLPEKSWEKFASIWEGYQADKKQILTEAGAPEKYLYFVIEGVQRVYYWNEEDQEATIVFSYAPSFAGVVDAFLLEMPSKYYFQTIQKSLFLRTSFRQLKTLTDEDLHLNYFIEKGVYMAFSGVLERLVELQCFSSEQKFRNLLQRSPHLLQIVPHKYLANYIGIDVSNFSKLMNKIKIGE